VTAAARSRRPVAFRIDQALIDAPHFPRDADWWTGFLPMWCNVVEQQPDGTIFAAVDGRQGPALAKFLAQTAGGRLALSAAPADPPAAVPPSRWDLWLEQWHTERAAAGLPSVRPW
jgi:hypothetical protein